MDSDEISKILARENSQSLNQIPADFYQDAAKYVRKLEAEILEINNRRSPESKLLEAEAERAISDLETLFMKRIKKVVIRAKNQGQARSERPIGKDLEKMLSVEKRLYDLVLEGIAASKSELLGPVLNPESVGKPVSWPQLAGKTEPGREKTQVPSSGSELFQGKNLFQNQELTPKKGRSLQPSRPGTKRPEEAQKSGEPKKSVEATGNRRAKTVKAGTGNTGAGRGGEKVTVASGKNDINKDFVLVRILKDLPTLTGADSRNYTLKTEDVVTLPQMNATVLLKRKAAKLISGYNGPETQS